MTRATRGTGEEASGNDLDPDYEPPEETSESSEDKAPPKRGAPEDEESDYDDEPESDATTMLSRHLPRQTGDTTSHSISDICGITCCDKTCLYEVDIVRMVVGSLRKMTRHEKHTSLVTALHPHGRR